jgi:hypothetical protein
MSSDGSRLEILLAEIRLPVGLTKLTKALLSVLSVTEVGMFRGDGAEAGAKTG